MIDSVVVNLAVFGMAAAAVAVVVVAAADCVDAADSSPQHASSLVDIPPDTCTAHLLLCQQRCNCRSRPWKKQILDQYTIAG